MYVPLYKCIMIPLLLASHVARIWLDYHTRALANLVTVPLFNSSTKQLEHNRVLFNHTYVRHIIKNILFFWLQAMENVIFLLLFQYVWNCFYWKFKFQLRINGICCSTMLFCFYLFVIWISYWRDHIYMAVNKFTASYKKIVLLLYKS